MGRHSDNIKNQMEGVGFEPTKASPTDLQSVPFGHSGTPPGYTQAGISRACKLANI
jgi:hypothetical protein